MTKQSPYTPLEEGHAFGILDERTLIEVTGKDRVTFLHNLCTNDVKALEAGHGCEAFFTNVQGKVLCHAMLFATAESIFISTDPELADQLLTHLDKYLIREDVVLTNQSTAFQTLLLAGPNSQQVVIDKFAVQLTKPLQHATMAKMPGAFVARVPFVAPLGFFIFSPNERTSEIAELLAASGATKVDADIVESARIQARFPSSGRDVTIDNLPQEVGRDELAISFTKGCYLGQETVARIDALGRVNKHLVSLRFQGSDVPSPGTPLTFEDKVVGNVTSSCWSPGLASTIALGYVRREVIEQESVLSSEMGNATVEA